MDNDDNPLPDAIRALAAAGMVQPGRAVAAAAAGVGHSRPRINGVRVRMYSGLRLRDPGRFSLAHRAAGVAEPDF